MTRWIGVVWIIVAVSLMGCDPTDAPSGPTETIDPINPTDETVITPPAEPAEPAEPVEPPHDPTSPFDTLLAGGTPVLAMFESPWSSTARQSELLLAELQAKFLDDIAFVLINTDSAPDLVEAHGVAEYPTTLLFDHGQEVARWEGPTTQAILKSDLEQFLQSIAAETALSDDNATEIIHE